MVTHAQQFNSRFMNANPLARMEKFIISGG